MLVSGAASKRALAASKPIKVGMLIDTSGPLEVFGQNKLRCPQIGIDELNEAGGLLGRPVELIDRDTQSNNQLFAQYAQELTEGRHVDVVFGATTSSSREIVRPVVNKARVPYFYDTNYEGGVCQKTTFCTSSTPALAHFECAPYANYDGGDHVVFVVRVNRHTTCSEPLAPLVFFRGRYRDLSEEPERQPAWPLPIHY